MGVFYRRKGVAEQRRTIAGLVIGIAAAKLPRMDAAYFSQWVVLNFSGSKTAGSSFTFAWISE